MASRDIEVRLGFKADTDSAMRNLEVLRNSLNQISATPFTVGKNLSADMQIAVKSADDLQKHLTAAMDVKTGNLDLKKLQNSLRSSGQSLSQLTSGLLRAGETGEKAFLATYQAISQSNLKLRESNTLLSKFETTLRNTARWQLSSSLLRGLTSGFQEAINYARDLNKSLNSIQIVTGQSADQMAKFALQANKSAKALSTSTTAYTDAALIYYQQGLTGDEVTKRTDTTVKLANVTRQSAEEVSNWMTAIWNNFDDGTKSIEYYADVLTRLGATTASSSDEIATGMQKFAAVADTVGLSYENAAAALATITATTRQSADVVGTSLKTLFSRMEQLKLGETLDDGTTLGQYSQALATIGVEVKNAAGELNSMDSIIQQTGERWKGLSRDQKVAVAQQVAGIRQYSQFMALMDNYDFYKKNVEDAKNSTGELQKQQEIYEQSWEGASKRLKASFESLWNVLVPTDTIVKLTNGLSDIVDGFSKVVKAAGGLRTIILLLATTVLSKFQGDIATSIDSANIRFQAFGKNVVNTFNKVKENAQNSVKENGIFGTIKNVMNTPVATNQEKTQNLRNKEPTGMQAEVVQGLRDSLEQKDANGKSINLSEGFKEQIRGLQQVENYNTQILNLKNKMSAAEFDQLNTKTQQLAALAKEKGEHKQRIEDLKMELDIQKDMFSLRFNKNDFKDNKTENGYKFEQTYEGKDAQSSTGVGKAIKMAAGQAAENASVDSVNVTTTKDGTATITGIQNAEQLKALQTESLGILSNTVQVELQISDAVKNRTSFGDNYIDILENIVNNAEKENLLSKDQLEYLKERIAAMKEAGVNSEATRENSNKMKDYMLNAAEGAELFAKGIGVGAEETEAAKKNGEGLFIATKKLNQVTGQFKVLVKQLGEGLSDVVKRAGSIGNSIVQGLKGVGQAAMGINMVTSAVQSLGEAFEDGFDFTKFLSGLGSLGMALPMAISGINGLISTIGSLNIIQGSSLAISEAQIGALVTRTIVRDGEVSAILAEGAAEKIAAAAKASGATVQQITLVLSKLKTGASLKEALAAADLTKATWAQVAANLGLNASLGVILLIILAVVAAVALLAIGIKALTDLYNADAIAAENANKALEQQKEIVNETQQAYDDLKATIEDYKNSQKAIDAMVEGTQEWRDAVREANQQVTDLVAKYPELAKHIKNINGRMVIDEEALDDVLEKEEAKLDKQIAAQTNAQIVANKANAKSKRTNFTRDSNNYNLLTEEEQIRVQSNQGQVSAETLMGNHLQELEDLYNSGDLEAYEKALAEISAKDEDLANRIDELITSNATLEESNSLLRESMIQQAGQSNQKYQDSQYKEYIDAMGGQDIKEDSQFYKDAKDDVDKLFEDGNEDFWAEYIKAVYGEEATTGDNNAESNNYRVTDMYGAGATLQRKTEDGTWETIGEEDSLNEETAREILIQAKAQEKALSPENIEKIEKTAEETTKALLDSGIKQREGEKDEVFRARVNQIGAAYASGKGMDLTGLTWSEVEALDPSKIGDLTNEYGNKLADELQKAKDNYEKAITEKNLQSSSEWLADKEERDAQELSKVLEEAEMSTEAFEQFAKNYSQYGDAAEDVAKKVLKTSNAVTKLNKTITDNEKALDPAKEGTAEYAEAVTQLQTDLKDFLGVDLGYDYVKDNLDQVKAAAQGDEEAIESLQIAAAKKIVTDLNIKDEGFRQQLLDLADQVDNLDFEATMNLDITDTVDKMNEMLKTGQITAEQMQSYFDNIGYSPDIDGYDTVDGPETETTITGTWAGKKINATTKSSTKLKIPKIKGAHYVGPQHTSTPSSSKASKSSSGGGGGSSQEFKGEKDRYHEINELISKQEKALDNLAKAKERVYGKKYLDLLDQEIEKQKELIKSNEEKLRQARAYYERDKQELLNNFEVQIDSAGNIINYEELQDSLIAEGNQDKFDKSNELLSKYEESMHQVEEQVSKLNDEMDKLYEFNLTKIETTVQIKTEIADDDKAYLDFLMSRIEDDAFAAAEAIQILGEETRSTLGKIDAYKEAIAKVESELAAGNITEAQAVEKIREYRDAIIDLTKELDELQKSVPEKLIAQFDAWNEKLDRNREIIEFYGSTLEHYKNIIDIVGKDRLGINNAIIRQLSDARIANSQSQLQAEKARRDAIQSTLNSYYQERSSILAKNINADTTEIDKLIETTEDKFREAESEVMSLTESTLEAIKDGYSETLNLIAEEFEKSVSGMYDNLEDLRSAWDRQQEVADKYLKSYEQTYELNKLNRQIQKDIDKSSNIKNQQALHNLQEEMLQMSKDGQQLSKYDLEYLQKKYDLMVAEQAFRDAQNAKSVVRLQRDSEGNFSYVYTADQAATDSAEQNYEDKLYALQEFNDKVFSGFTESYIKLNEWYAEQLRSAQDHLGKGSEAFQEYAEKLQQQYMEDMWYITSEQEKLTSRNLEINETFSAGVAQTYNETYLGKILPDYDSFASLYNDTTVIMEKANNELLDNETKFSKESKAIYEDFADTVGDNIDKVKAKSKDAGDEALTMGAKMAAALETSTNEAIAFQEEFSKRMGTVQTDIGNTITKINDLIAKLADQANAVNNTANAYKNLAAAQGQANYQGSPSGNDSSDSSSYSYTPSSQTQKIWHMDKTSNTSGSTWYWNPKVNSKHGSKIFGNYVFLHGSNPDEFYLYNGTISQFYQTVNSLKSSIETRRPGGVQITKGTPKYEYKYYDTGGYTGSWGPEGRLAMLHQKEIVLNAHDTENFLAAVEIVRGISDQIEKNAMVMRSNNEFANYKTQVKPTNETLQQEVTIHAEFPNATDHNEIEEAFRNLTNLASQYTNRKF